MLDQGERQTTQIAYFDETGDDGINNSPTDLFVLTSMCIETCNWQKNFDHIRAFRQQLKEKYGFHISQEMHTKKFVQNKNPYRDYKWNDEKRLDMLRAYTMLISELDISIINVIINKKKLVKNDLNVLETALTYNIQRIDNNSSGDWNYFIITDPGRIAPMRKTARKIRAYNPITSMYSSQKNNQPIQYMVEDIFEKDSRESYFVQICDFVSYFVFLYYRTKVLGVPLKNRISKVINEDQIEKMMDHFKETGVFNTKASGSNPYGFVVHPR